MATLAITLTVYLFSSFLINSMLVAVIALIGVKVFLYLWQQIPLI